MEAPNTQEYPAMESAEIRHSRAAAHAVARMTGRSPLSPEVAQMALLLERYAPPGLPGLPVPGPDALAGAAYRFLESGCPDLALRACERLPEATHGYDIDLIRYRAGAPPRRETGKPRILLAASIGTLPWEDANRRQAICLDRMDRIRDEDGRLVLLNVNLPEDLVSRPGWRQSALPRSTRDLPGVESHPLPLMSDVLAEAARVAALEGAPIFAFINSDILLTNECLFTLRRLLESEWDTLGFVRTSLPSLDRDTPEHWEGQDISGTDLFAFRTDWWAPHAEHFSAYAMGGYWWDGVYAGVMMAHSRFYYVSQQRGVIFHARHEGRSALESPQARYNRAIQDGRDRLYLILQERYCERLNAFIREHRCLPVARQNMALHEDELHRAVRNRLGEDIGLLVPRP